MIIHGTLEKFLGGPTQSPHDRLHITINAQYVIGLNRNAYRILGKPEAVYLHFSRVDSVIAIEPTHSFRMPAAFPVKPKNSVGWRINASPFCKHFDIRIETTERFVSPEFHNDNKRLLLKLTDTVTVKQFRRKKG